MGARLELQNQKLSHGGDWAETSCLLGSGMNYFILAQRQKLEESPAARKAEVDPCCNVVKDGENVKCVLNDVADVAHLDSPSMLASSTGDPRVLDATSLSIVSTSRSRSRQTSIVTCAWRHSELVNLLEYRFSK